MIDFPLVGDLVMITTIITHRCNGKKIKANKIELSCVIILW